MAEVKSFEAQQRCTWDCLAADLFSAVVASALVSPWVTAIDSLVFNKAATGASLTSSVRKWIAKPKITFGGLFIPFLVYFGTYATANLFDSFHAMNNCADPTTVSAAPSKFFATTAVSTGLCVYKDGYFAGLANKSPAPLLSYLLFTSRDALTVFASFNLPTLVTPKIAEFPFPKITPFSNLFQSDDANLRLIQIMSPAAAQMASTPIHLLGLDFSNRQYRLGIRERFSMIRQHITFATPLRMMRILPPFGIGNVVNTSCRNSMLTRAI
ncbi:Fc.00g046420.m01.CDS01 [Cosmosporella sp. VM-42]